MLLSVSRKASSVPESAATYASPLEPLVIKRLSRGNGFPTFDLTISPGTCVTLSGPSGSGKSMLLRLVADLDPGTGSARIGSLIRETLPANEWRRLVVYVAADAGWWTSPVSAHMTDRNEALRLSAELGLPAALMNASPENISSGERQRMALVRALILRPRFLLLDEPTSALDTASMLKVEKLLTRMKQEGMGLLMVSHDPDQVARIADRRYVLSDGQLVEVAS